GSGTAAARTDALTIEKSAWRARPEVGRGPGGTSSTLPFHRPAKILTFVPLKVRFYPFVRCPKASSSLPGRAKGEAQLIDSSKSREGLRDAFQLHHSLGRVEEADSKLDSVEPRENGAHRERLGGESRRGGDGPGEERAQTFQRGAESRDIGRKSREIVETNLTLRAVGASHRDRRLGDELGVEPGPNVRGHFRELRTREEIAVVLRLVGTDFLAANVLRLAGPTHLPDERLVPKQSHPLVTLTRLPDPFPTKGDRRSLFGRQRARKSR